MQGQGKKLRYCGLMKAAWMIGVFPSISILFHLAEALVTLQRLRNFSSTRRYCYNLGRSEAFIPSIESELEFTLF